MIIGIGIDLITNARFEKELARGEWQLADGLFTRREINRCRTGRNPAIRYAACFAAKEAALKALGANGSDTGALREIEIDFDGGSRCGIVLYKRMKAEFEHLGARSITLSITSGKQQTGAMVIVES